MLCKSLREILFFLKAEFDITIDKMLKFVWNDLSANLVCRIALKAQDICLDCFENIPNPDQVNLFAVEWILLIVSRYFGRSSRSSENISIPIKRPSRYMAWLRIPSLLNPHFMATCLDPSFPTITVN